MSNQNKLFTNPKTQAFANKIIAFCSKGEVSQFKHHKAQFDIFSIEEKILVYQSGFNHACLCDKIKILEELFFEPSSPVYKDISTFFIGFQATFDNQSIKSMGHLLKHLWVQWEEDNSQVPQYYLEFSNSFISSCGPYDLSDVPEDFIWFDELISYMDKIQSRHTHFSLEPTDTIVQKALLHCFAKNSQSVAQFLIQKYQITGEEDCYKHTLEPYRSKSKYQALFQTMGAYKEKQVLDKCVALALNEDTHRGTERNKNPYKI